MKNIMLDLETMGITANSAIIAIGACEFDDFEITKEFYINVDLEKMIRKGFDIDGSTIMWWMKQSDEAREVFQGKKASPAEALEAFREFMGKNPRDIQVWGNGSDFDNTLLINMFQKYGVKSPWDFWNNRCFRTLKASFPQLKIERKGTHHNALDDAKFQAEYLIELVNKHKLKNVL